MMTLVADHAGYLPQIYADLS